MDVDSFWDTYPQTPVAGPVKFYYLLAFAFYFTQIFILNIEAPRKDHNRMLGHHIVTVGLIASSWAFNFTRPGCTILFLLDWCDIYLPVSVTQNRSLDPHLTMMME